jgi:hypothetical protein
MTFPLEPSPKLGVVLDHAVVHDTHLARAIDLWVRILIRWATMSGPPGVSDADGADRGVMLEHVGKIGELTDSLPDLKVASFGEHCDPC